MTHTFAPFVDLAGVPAAPSGSKTNLGKGERIGSGIAGAALISYGVARRDVPGLILGVLGTLLVYRGASGHCKCYEQLGIDTTNSSNSRGVHGNAGIRIEHSIDVARSPMELYHYWHPLTNLPEIMPHVKSVTVDGPKSHWVVTGPAGRDVAWDAEFINEKPGELIAWQSLPDSTVHHAGSIRFEPRNDGASTRITATMEYLPPGGKAGAAIASILGASPLRHLRENLSAFKDRMENQTG